MTGGPPRLVGLLGCLCVLAATPAGAWAATCGEVLRQGGTGQHALAEFWQGYLSGFNLDHLRHVQEREPAINLHGYVNGKRIDLTNAGPLEAYCRSHGDAPLADAADAVFDQMQRDDGGAPAHG